MKLPHRRQFLHVAAGAATLPAASRIARAQSPPRVIVAAGPGGLADIVAKLAIASLATRFDQTLVIENRPGAAGNLATELVARTPQTAVRSLCAARLTRSMPRFMTTSILISRAISYRSQASCACRLSWRSICQYQPLRFWNL
jgi:tripartite-type tricarboxylate transporter receptor subunit TctC